MREARYLYKVDRGGNRTLPLRCRTIDHYCRAGVLPRSSIQDCYPCIGILLKCGLDNEPQRLGIHHIPLSSHTNGAWNIVVHSNTFKAELVFSPENTTRVAKYWETCQSWVRVMRQAKRVDSAIGVCVISSSNNTAVN